MTVKSCRKVLWCMYMFLGGKLCYDRYQWFSKFGYCRCISPKTRKHDCESHWRLLWANRWQKCEDYCSSWLLQERHDDSTQGNACNLLLMETLIIEHGFLILTISSFLSISRWTKIWPIGPKQINNSTTSKSLHLCTV